jgi:ribonuclease HII
MQYIGIDEVGRGAWSGPLLVVAARGIDSLLPCKVTDSKLLTKLQRDELLASVIDYVSFGEGWVWSDEIDQVGMAAAMRLAIWRSLQSLAVDSSEKIIIDGPTNYCPPQYTKVKPVIKADRLHPLVSCASIYAKVTRDKWMHQSAHLQYPKYGYDRHVGYGTLAHRRALELYGVTPLHRKSFRPIRNFC